MITRMKDYALKIMSREIGNKRAIEWINNYKFPENNRELIKLSNIWHGTIWNILMDISKPSKEELCQEDIIKDIQTTLKNETFYKYYKRIGPNNVTIWLNNYKFPDSYEDIVRIKSSWNNITQKLNNVIISKKDLYQDLANYYKDKSKIQFIKYKILTLLYNYE